MIYNHKAGLIVPCFFLIFESDGSIVISDAANDFDAAFKTLLKPYIGVIGTYLGVKGVK